MTHVIVLARHELMTAKQATIWRLNEVLYRYAVWGPGPTGFSHGASGGARVLQRCAALRSPHYARRRTIAPRHYWCWHMRRKYMFCFYKYMFCFHCGDRRHRRR